MQFSGYTDQWQNKKQNKKQTNKKTPQTNNNKTTTTTKTEILETDRSLIVVTKMSVFEARAVKFIFGQLTPNRSNFKGSLGELLGEGGAYMGFPERTYIFPS